jgi:hypothetical protein
MPRKEFKGIIATIYAESSQEYDGWVIEAKAAGVSLSKWISEMIIRAKSATKRSARLDDSSDLQAKISKLMQEIETKDLLIEKQRTELLKIKQAAFLQPELRGVIQFDVKLVKLLDKGGVWTQDKLCEALHIDLHDSDAMKIVARQLQELRGFDFIEETARGWRWIK